MPGFLRAAFRPIIGFLLLLHHGMNASANLPLDKLVATFNTAVRHCYWSYGELYWDD